jgi:hypothetical protein
MFRSGEAGPFLTLPFISVYFPNCMKLLSQYCGQISKFWTWNASFNWLSLTSSWSQAFGIFLPNAIFQTET